MRENQPSKIEFDVTLEDIVHFNRYHFSHSVQGKKLFLKNQITFTLCFMLICIYFAFEKQDWGFFLPVGIVSSTLYVLWAKRELLSRTEKSVRQMFKGDANREILGVHQVEIHDDGIYIRSQASEGKTYWSGLSQITQDEHYAYIYIGSVKALVIKKSSVREGQLSEFLEEVQRHIPKFQNHTP